MEFTGSDLSTAGVASEFLSDTLKHVSDGMFRMPSQ